MTMPRDNIPFWSIVPLLWSYLWGKKKEISEVFTPEGKAMREMSEKHAESAPISVRPPERKNLTRTHTIERTQD